MSLLHRFRGERFGRSEAAKHSVALAAEAGKTIARDIELAHIEPEKRLLAETFVRIAVAQVQAGEPESAKTTFDSASTIAENNSLEWDQILGAIILGQAAIKDVAGVTSTAERIIEKHRGKRSLPPFGVQEDMAVALAKVGRFEQAKSVADEIRSEVSKAEAISGIAQALAEAGNTEAATGMFAFAIELAEKGNEDFFRDDVFKMIAVAQAEVGSVTAAIDTVQRLRWRTEQAKLLGRISMILLQKGRDEASRDLFEIALITSGLEARQWLAMFSDCGQALGQVAVALAKAGEFGTAIEIAHWRELKGYQSNALQAIAVEQGKVGDFAGAMRTAEDIIDPDHPGREVALIEVVAAQTRAQLFEAAIETAQRIGESNRSDLLGQIAYGQMQVGQLSAALNTAQSIQLDGFRAKALQQIALAQAEAGNAEQARAIFADAIAAAHCIESKFFRGSALSRIAVAQGQAGQFDDAVKTAYETPDKQQQVRALGKVAAALRKSGETAAAVSLFASALRIARESEWPSEDYSHEIAISMAEAGDFASALEITKSVSNIRRRDEAFEKLAMAQAKAGEFASALESALCIETGRESVLREISIAQAQFGDFTAAVETARGLKWGSDRARAFAEIVMAMSGADQTEAARTVLGTINIDGARDDELQAFAIAQAQVGDLGSAMLTAQKSSKWKRKEVLRALALRAGAAFGLHAITMAENILAERNERLPDIAAALVEVDDKINFKRLLIPCAYYLNASYRVCGLLGRLYPAQAASVGRVLQQWSSAEGED